MSKIARLAILALFILLGVVGYFIVEWINANNMARLIRKDEPFGIRLAFVDNEDRDSLASLAQLIVYPEYKHVLFYFVNTDAHLEPDDRGLKKMRISDADKFENFTGIRNEYSITLNRNQVSRLYDLIGGLSIFVEKPTIYDDSRFQYPQGVQHFPGDQIAEYMFSIENEDDPTRVHLNGIDRVHRIESVLLNSLWNLESLLQHVSDENVWAIFSSIPETDISPDELHTLLRYFMNEKVETSVLEVPLEEITGERIRGIYYRKKLQVKENRARSIYLEFNNNLMGGRIGKGSFMLEVLNGTEINGLARRVKQNLQINDIMVMDVDNYPYKPVAQTIILDRSGNSAYTKTLMKNTGMKPSRVYFRRKPVSVDNTLILGDDFNIKKMKLY